MGLLDGINSDGFRMGMGLLAAGSARNDGAGMGQRLQEALGGFDAYKRGQTQAKMQQMQMEQAQAQMAQAKQERELAKRYAIPATPAVQGAQVPLNMQGDTGPNLYSKSVSNMSTDGAQPAKPAGFDFAGYAQGMAAINPMESLRIQQAIAKDDSPLTLKDGESLIDRKTLKPILSIPKSDAEPSAVKEYKFAVAQGYLGTFQQFQLEGKKAGATNISTKIENKMGESLAGQIGPMVKDTYGAANGAVSQIDAAGRIVKAVDGGQIIAGPLAGGRLKVAQIGQLLGVTGKDDADTIARSREVIRGLSEMTLQGRKQMTGQGAITESEGKLAEKAMSGDIADLTPAEIKQLARASSRAAKFVYDQHQQNLSNMQADPNTAKLAGFYKTMPLPKMDFMNEPAPTSIHDRAAAILGGK